MKPVRLLPLVLLSVLAFASALKAELHELLKPRADGYNKAMQGYEETRKAQIEAARIGYLAVLDASRKRSERAGKAGEVAAIDAEIKAVKAGPVTGDLPAGLPSELAHYRKTYVDAPDKAAKAILSVVKFTRQSYLHTLDGLTEAARRGKSPALEADVERERARVVEEMKAAEKAASTDNDDAKARKDKGKK